MATSTSLDTQDHPTVIALDVPAEASAARVVRAVASSVASGIPLGYDRIEDLALAIGEAYSFLLTSEPRAVRATLEPTPDGIHIALSAVEALRESPESWETSLNRIVLESIASDVSEAPSRISFSLGATTPAD